MNKTTAIMALLGGLLLVLYAIRLMVQKRKVLKNGLEISAKVAGFTGKHTTYRFTHNDKTITAYSLQRTNNSTSRMNKIETVIFNPETPKYVVIAKNRNIEMNAYFMILVGLLAIAGGIIGVLN